MSTIYEVASMAGVSPKTAARILAGETGRAVNRERVLKAAKRLKYVRNQQAVNFRSRQSGLIGLIVPDIANPQYPFFCRFAHDAALEHGYRMILANTYGHAEEEASTLRMFQANRIEGLILVCSEGEQDKACDHLIKSLLIRNIPVIIGGRSLRGIPADRFALQNVKAVDRLVDYLVKTGRKRLAFIGGVRELLATRERYQGFKKGLIRHRLKEVSEYIKFQDFTIESGIQQTAALLRIPKHRHPDAIVCANDMIALGAIRVLQENGIRIPEEMAVAGFDDISLAEIVRPQLTTLRQPLERMARDGIDLIVDRIRRKDISKPRILSYDPELIIRESA